MPASAVPPVDLLDADVLLNVLAEVTRGDVTAPMPLARTEVAGKVADGGNDVTIAVTAEANDDERQHRFEAEANDDVPRPADTAELLAARRPWMSTSVHSTMP
jgi:CheY-like chemotaxis protein